MEQNRKALKSIMAALGLLTLIFNSNLALKGAGSGIKLCVDTLIPSLFPFFVLSMVLTNSLDTDNVKMIDRIGKYFGISTAASSVLIPAVLGGYPVGAKCIGDLYYRKLISREEAERLLSFCNNAGPSFLFGMVSRFFPERETIWLIWLVHLFSAAITAMVVPAEGSELSVISSFPKNQKTEVILSAARAMCLTCCWVVMFRIFITILQEWFLWMMPVWIQVLLIGVLELANGCCSLMLITDAGLRFILCSCMLAFGGICVLFQTISVTEGLSVRSYLKGKVIQTIFSLLLSCVILTKNGVFWACVIPAFVMIIRKIQNKYRNPKLIPV